MINPLTFIGEPQSFNGKFNIYPPTVRQILTTPAYPQYNKILTITADDIKDEIIKKDPNSKVPTPFEFLLINSFHNANFQQIAKEAFEFFTHEKIYFFFEEKMIVVGDLEQTIPKIKSLDDLVTIKEEEYFDFQNAIRAALGEKEIKPPEPENPDEDPRITEMKRKARERDRIKAKHNAKNGISLSTSLTAICCMGIGITPLNVGEMSYATIGPIITMMQDKEKYDVDIRSLLAGADSKKIKPKYWIRNSDKE